MGEKMRDLEELGIGDCYKKALIRAILEHKLIHRPRRVDGKDGMWIGLPESVLKKIVREAEACYVARHRPKKGGNGKPPPLLPVVTLP